MIDKQSENNYTIIVRGHIDDRWQDWFPDMKMSLLAEGLTQISGSVVDQSELFGMLSRIRDLRLPLLLVERGDIEVWRKRSS